MRRRWTSRAAACEGSAVNVGTRSWQWPGWLVALAAVLLALALRLLGIRLGLPYFHHWDECWIADNSKKMLMTEDWEPQTYQYGAPLSAITAWIWVTISETWPKVHFYDPNDGLQMRVIARIVTAIIASSGAAGVYLAARYAVPGNGSGRVRATYAALLYATAAELVTHGRYAVTDADLVAWVAWSLGAAALFLGSGSFGWAVGTLLFAAMALSFKVTAATALSIPVFSFMLRAVQVPGLRAPAWGRAAMMAAIPLAVAFFLLMNPHVAIHWQSALRDIQNRSRQTIEGGFPLFLLRQPGWDHLGAVVGGIALMAFHRWAVPAVVAALLAVVGLGLAVRARSLVGVVGIGHAVLTILSIALTSRAYLYRNYLVALPILCVGFGFALDAAHKALGAAFASAGTSGSLGWWRRAPWLGVAAGFALVYVAVPIGQAVAAQTLSVDPRERALEWISAQASHGSNKGKVSVMATGDITSMCGYRSDWVRGKVQQPNIRMLKDSDDPAEVEKQHPDYVLTISYPDESGDWPELWHFQSVKGYHQVARFDASPYEHRREMTPTWGGFYNAAVLKRD
jgi:MFS family permease